MKSISLRQVTNRSLMLTAIVALTSVPAAMAQNEPKRLVFGSELAPQAGTVQIGGVIEYETVGNPAVYQPGYTYGSYTPGGSRSGIRFDPTYYPNPRFSYYQYRRVAPIFGTGLWDGRAFKPACRVYRDYPRETYKPTPEYPNASKTYLKTSPSREGCCN